MWYAMDAYPYHIVDLSMLMRIVTGVLDGVHALFVV